MNKLIWIIVAVALAACGKKSDDAAKGSAAAGGGAAAAPTCADAAAKAVASLGPGADAMGGVKDKLKAIYATRCTEDRWPEEVIKCYESAAGMQALTACRNRLPSELNTKLITEIRATMAGAGVRMGGPPMGHGGGSTAAPGPAAAGAPAPGAPAK